MKIGTLDIRQSNIIVEMSCFYRIHIGIGLSFRLISIGLVMFGLSLLQQDDKPR